MKGGAQVLRWPICVLASLWLLPAAADCEGEAYAARTSVWKSGAFYFETTIYGTKYQRRVCGEIDPLIAEYERSCESEGDPRREEISIRNQRWMNDGFGWYSQGSGWSWGHGAKLPSLSLSRPFSHVVCHGRVKIDDRELIKYEFAAPAGDRHNLAEVVFIDANTARPARFETRNADASEGSITIYFHDPLIRIEPPIVDLEKRRARSVRRFQDIVQDAEPVCREEVLTALGLGRTASFQYDVVRFFHTGLFGMHGVFVPPGSVHNRMHSHRAEMELISIGEQSWKRDGQRWVEAREERGRADWVIGELMPSPDRVGHVKCLGKVSVAGVEYRVYNYDLYRDWESALKFYGKRRLMVEDATGLPIQTVGLHSNGARAWVETRWYDSALAVEPPPTESNPQQTAPKALRRMTLEEHRRAMSPEQFAQEISPK